MCFMRVLCSVGGQAPWSGSEVLTLQKHLNKEQNNLSIHTLPGSCAHREKLWVKFYTLFKVFFNLVWNVW